MDVRGNTNYYEARTPDIVLLGDSITRTDWLAGILIGQFRACQLDGRCDGDTMRDCNGTCLLAEGRVAPAQSAVITY